MKQSHTVKRTANLQAFVANLSPWLVLAILLAYTYARFFVAPYAGFVFSTSNGSVEMLFLQGEPGADLHEGDKILKIGSVAWEDYQSDLRQAFFMGVQPGQVVPILVERAGQTITVPWVYPGSNPEETISRLANIWWLSFIFWFFGAITVLILRPKDRLWQLLITANFLTAIWVMAGSVSQWAIWESAIVLRMAIWLCLPVYLHLHWVFPRPLGRLPGWILGFTYLSAVALATAAWFQILPTPTYFLGFLLAFAGSALLIAAHAIAQADQRRNIGRIAIFVGLAVAPSVVLGLTGLSGEYPRIGVLALFGLPAIPLAYLYTAYRRRLGGLELRTNRAISLFIFLTLLLTGSILAALVTTTWFTSPGAVISIEVFIALLVALVSIIVYPRFQQQIEQRLLGMPLPPTQLLETYAERITTSLDTTSLVNLLKDEILPSLLVRQSTLLRVDENYRAVKVYAMGLEAVELPEKYDVAWLLAHAGQYISPDTAELMDHPYPMVRLVLPLNLAGKLAGLWLLGRRDPDDFYAQSEIAILQALANQTAVALANILQTERLHALYQTDIERQEAERSTLALELHDDVLGQMAMLKMHVGESVSAQFEQAYQSASEHIRQIINGLRPAMLNYGLRAAIDELADEAPELTGSKIAIQVELPPSDMRYPPQVELHLYRIVQQACQNALTHAQASVIRISGSLDPERVELIVNDGGIGVASGVPLDLVGLLVSRHFGLAGMYERAALIGAELQIESIPGHGTKVSVNWKAPF